MKLTERESLHDQDLPEINMLSIRETGKTGLGVFAERDFLTGEMVLSILGKICDTEDIEFGSRQDDVSFQIGDRTFLDPTGQVGEFINHSCDANIVLQLIDGQPVLVGIRKISKGEEVTFDYSLECSFHPKDTSWKMDCNCGSTHCRRVIRDFKHLSSERQRELIEKGMVLDYIAVQFKTLLNV